MSEQQGNTERTFGRETEALPDVFQFVDDFLASNDIEEGAAFATKLAVEELFTNLVRHNLGGQDSIAISLRRGPGEIVVELKDFDVASFDITKVPPVDTEQALQDRQIGGLGLHLVRSVIDRITYEYYDRTMHITAVKKLGS